MELLLNLIWIALVLGSFLIFTWRRRPSSHKGISYGCALLALACVLLLLFPIISASDDLHPTQAVLEEATRRVQHLAPALHIATGASAPELLPTLLLGLLLVLIKLQPAMKLEPMARSLHGHRTSRDGRAPPFC